MRVFTGVQATGKMHIGNYLGAIKQLTELQEKEECFFMIADLHSLTIPRDPKTFPKDVFEVAIELLAAGLNPEKCIIFIQSHVKEHTELAWLLNTITPIGELMRMTQYKDKSREFKKNINAGLLNYPILQAADILLYQTDVVPVGKDQAQHLELTSALAQKFNKRFGETFKVPKPLFLKIGSKIMSLSDPKKKMSKSLPKTCLYLTDEPEQIKSKIATAVTDSGKIIKYDPVKKPGISNLLTIYSLFGGKDIKTLEKDFKNKSYSDFKKSLAVLLIDYLEPFRRKRQELLSREFYVQELLSQGARRAQIIAQSTMVDARKKIGIL